MSQHSRIQSSPSILPNDTTPKSLSSVKEVKKTEAYPDNNYLGIDSPRSRRGTWRVPSSNNLVLAPTSPISPKTPNNLSGESISKSFTNSNQEDIELSIVENFSSGSNSGQDISASSKEAYKRVACSEKRIVPNRGLVKTLNASFTESNDITHLMTNRKEKKKPIITTTKVLQSQQKKHQLMSTISQKTKGIVSKKQKFRVPTLQYIPYYNEDYPPLTVQSARGRPKKLYEEDDTIFGSRGVKEKTETEDPFRILTSETVSGKNWVQMVVERSMKKSQIAQNMKETTNNTSNALSELERKIKDIYPQNAKKILELKLANVHLRNINKLIKEFRDITNDREHREDWYSRTKRFLVFYSELIESRYVILKK